MAERKGNKKRLCINLSLFTLTDNNNSNSNKSPKKFEDPNGAVVGLGIVAAMNKESKNRAAIIAISPRSTTSNPIPIFTSFKKKPSIEEMEMCEEYTCVISHVGTNLVKKREYFDGQFIGNSNFNAYQKTVNHTTSFTMADFLNSCFLCKKQLKGLDIFMYRLEFQLCFLGYCNDYMLTFWDLIFSCRLCFISKYVAALILNRYMLLF
ncbi:FCS-Like Zinc finger 14-like [Solanum pennellii]|uniref:FCS-Like Zinc finger 14-like n=1 Tax=Solanum pennellii TaxID=28526 RepID=A0ABM1H5G9_SOLPN|nr:FCS-Like Zinc finger 14-like [Solanum pennellii]